MLLSEKTDHTRNNNLDLIRLVAAVMVIWSHAYPIVLGKGAEQPLTALTDGQFSLGDLGVAIFFVISGFLVSQSMFRLDDLTGYAKARILRIFPGLIFCVLLSILLIGPIFTARSTAEYFTNSQTYNYLIATTTLNFLSHFLPGVFESNPYGAYINGSLWTLKYEVLCYIMLALSWKLGIITKRRIALLITGLALLYISTKNEHLINLAKLSLLFFSGSLFYLYRKQIKLDYRLLAASAAALAGFNYSGHLNLALPIFGSYVIIYIGYRWDQLLNCTRHGDLSYGLYIYGWPAQQMLIALHPEMTVLQNIIFSIALAIPFAYASWHLIEEPFMRLRKYKLSNSQKKQPPSATLQ